MEKLREILLRANKLFETADHLAYVTYQLVNDPKLMITIAENLYNSLVLFMDALIYYERLYKRIPPVAENFESRFDIFKNKCAVRYNIPREQLLLINDLKNIIELRKESPIEFIRKNKFVICNNSYKMQTLTIDKIKSHIQTSKQFVEKINNILKNERLNR